MCKNKDLVLLVSLVLMAIPTVPIHRETNVGALRCYKMLKIKK